MPVDEELLRGAGIGSILAAQRAYADNRTRYGLVVPDAFVRGIRDLGYRRTGDAVAELIDNALQAFADRVDVAFGYEGSTSRKKPVQMAVIDNGHGMEPVMIRMAVMWGGTHRENDRAGLGRYGYGLPCASVSLGRRFTVYSKVADGGIHSVTLDLDALSEGAYTDRGGDIIVPAPVEAEMPDFVSELIARAHPRGWRSGTVILIEKLDRLEWITTQGLRENLSRQFGVTYQKLRGEASLFVDEEYVEPIDPLFLTPGFHLHDLDDERAEPLDPVRLEIREPDSNDYRGAITLRYAWFPPSFGSIDKTRDAVGLNANARFEILKDYHGILFSRNGRLIDVQTRTPWTSFINNDRYIKVEVEFAATLDEQFGVTTSKQQVTVSPFMWDRLREAGLTKAIEQLRIKVKEAKLARRDAVLAARPGLTRLSEEAMSGSAPRAWMEEQRSFDFSDRPYRLEIVHKLDAPFFWFSRDGRVRTLCLNAAHRFYDDIYDAPVASAEVRTALEILLFSLAEEAGEDFSAGHAGLLRWSRRLERALGMMASRLGEGDEKEDADSEDRDSG